MKLLFDVLTLINTILNYVLEKRSSDVTEFWHNVRGSNSHCLRNCCRDDKQATLLKISLKKMNVIFPKKYLTKSPFEDLLKKLSLKTIDQTIIQQLVDILSKLFRIHIKIVYPAIVISSKPLNERYYLKNILEFELNTENKFILKENIKNKVRKQKSETFHGNISASTNNSSSS